jgi:site-specific DNA-methyltransferase (adenine-specific)
LAIVDPPYGIGIVEQFKKTVKSSTSMFNLSNGIVGSEWDGNIPDESYFDELFRVSKNQIVWGGNYFIDYLHNTRSMVVWDKMNGTNPMADAEIAWTSFDTSVRMFRMHHFSKGYGVKTHPTQKPVALYQWLLANYAKQGDKILDTHVGSASSLIACHQAGFQYWGFELDADYYKAATERLERAKAQVSMVDIIPQAEQIRLQTP